MWLCRYPFDRRKKNRVNTMHQVRKKLTFCLSLKECINNYDELQKKKAPHNVATDWGHKLAFDIGMREPTKMVRCIPKSSLWHTSGFGLRYLRDAVEVSVTMNSWPIFDWNECLTGIIKVKKYYNLAYEVKCTIHWVKLYKLIWHLLDFLISRQNYDFSFRKISKQTFEVRIYSYIGHIKT